MSRVIAKLVWVGLDYHACGVQVCILDGEGRVLANFFCANDWKALARAVAAKGRVARAAIECCCGAANLAKELVEKAGWDVRLAHPGFVSRMKQNPDKSDFSDARLLADLVRVGYLPRVWLAPDEIVDLRRLVRLRQQLVNDRRDVKLRIRALLRDERLDARMREDGGRPWTRAWLQRLRDMPELRDLSRFVMNQQLDRLADLDQRVRQVEQQLAAAVREDAVVQRLLQEPGIGLITAATLRAEVGQFDRFRNGKQLARFCATSPRNASSGQRQADAGLVKAGNPQLRATLIEAGHRLMRYQPRWKALAEQMLQRGKPYSVVVAAITNRWVRRLYHQMQPENLAVAG